MAVEALLLETSSSAERKIAERTAFIISGLRPDRKRTHGFVKHIYRLRSDLVHANPIVIADLFKKPYGDHELRRKTTSVPY